MCLMCLSRLRGIRLIELGSTALPHTFMAISGQGCNPGPGHNALLFSIGIKGSFSYQNHRQSHTTLHTYIVTNPPAQVMQQTSRLEGHPAKYWPILVLLNFIDWGTWCFNTARLYGPWGALEDPCKYTLKDIVYCLCMHECVYFIKFWNNMVR